MYQWSDPAHPAAEGINETAGEAPHSSRWEVYDPEQPLRPEKDRLLWLKKTIEEANVPGAALFLPQYSCFRAFEVYLDNVRIYKSGELAPAFINRHLYIKWHLIPLPVDYYGKTLLFRFFSDHPQLIGVISPIYLGEISSVMSRVVMRDLDISILGLLMIIGGLFGTAVLLVYYRLKNYPLLYCSIMAICGGVYILTESNVTPLMFDHPILQSYLHYVTFFLFVGGSWAFLEQTVPGNSKRFYRLGFRYQIAYLVVATMLDLLEIVSWDISFNAGMALLGVSIIAAEVGVFKMSLAGNLEARMLCIGYGILGLSGAWDILAGLGILKPHRVIFPWGLVLLLASLALVLILRYRNERSEAEETIRRSEERFRNLFENAPISILEVDFLKPRPVVICANTPTAELFGIAPGNLVFFPLENLFSSEALPALGRAVDSLKSATHATMESTCLREDGVKFPARIGISLTQTTGLGRVVLTLEDITEETERRSEEEAIAEERRRIAREIHDGLAQDLAVMNMKASVWRRMVDGRPEQMHAEIKLFQQLLKKNIQEVRRCIFALRPVDLDELGFFEATRRFVRDFGEQNRIEASFEVIGSENDLPHRLEPVLFRIVQETLNNARKHARAETVRIGLEIAVNRSVRLDIRDDGKGFDTAQLENAFRNGHLGIKQMRERVSRQGGSFNIESGKGKGTRIQVALP
jgi:PAS domain S-box-containing protein